MLTFSSISASCLPFYIFLTIFRVMSFSLIVVVLRVYSILLYIILLSILFLCLFFSTSSRDRKTTRKERGLFYFIVLPFRTMFTTGFLRQRDKETIFQVFWFLCNSLLVIALSVVVNLKLSGEFSSIESIYSFFNLSKVQLIKYDLAFNVTVGTIIFTGIVSTCLYLCHIKNWKSV